MASHSLFKYFLGLLFAASFCKQATGDLHSDLQKAEDALATTISAIEDSIMSADAECPSCPNNGGHSSGGHSSSGGDSDAHVNERFWSPDSPGRVTQPRTISESAQNLVQNIRPCGDSCVQDMARALKEEVVMLVDTVGVIQEQAASICPRCRVDKPTTGDPGFVVFDFPTKTLATIHPNGTVLGSFTPPLDTRGMYHNPLTQRVFIFDQPVKSYTVTLQDEQTVPNTTIDAGAVLGSMEGDPFKNELYMTFFSLNQIWKVGMDGSNATKILDTSRPPLGSRIDTCKGILYWMESIAPYSIKSVNIEGTLNVTTLLEVVGEQPRGLDVDFDNEKLYWCSAIGNLYELDLISSINTLLINTPGGSCSGLRLCNGFIYSSHVADTGIRKHELNGTFVEILIEGTGLFTQSGNHYFNLLLI